MIEAPPDDNKVVDFDRGSSRMRESDAFGHVADKLGEVSDHLRAMAFRMGIRGKSLRATYAALLNNMTMLRDSMRAVALLRGNEHWLPLAAAVVDMRESLGLLETEMLRGWPTLHFLNVADKLDQMKIIVEKKRHAKENNSVAVIGRRKR